MLHQYTVTDYLFQAGIYLDTESHTFATRVAPFLPQMMMSSECFPDEEAVCNFTANPDLYFTNAGRKMMNCTFFCHFGKKVRRHCCCGPLSSRAQYVNTKLLQSADINIVSAGIVPRI